MHRQGATSYKSLRASVAQYSRCPTRSTYSRYKSSASGDEPFLRPGSAQQTQFNALTKLIIDRTAQGETSNWRNSPSLRGAEKNLTHVIKSRSRAPSAQKETYSAGMNLLEDAEESASSECFEPGTFVETRRNEISSYGVVLAEKYIDRQWNVIMLTSAGEVWSPIRADVMFAIPSAIPSDLTARCGLQEISTKPSELSARVETLKRLRQIERSIENAYVHVNQKALDIYTLVKAQDEQKWAVTTINDVARLIFPQPTLFTIFATHKLLMEDSLHFVAQHSYRDSHSFDVRPQADVNLIETVNAWTRLPNSPINQFGKKAKAIVDINQKNYEESHAEVPSCYAASHTWNDEDKKIIEFLMRSLRPRRSTQKDPYSIGQSHILKQIHPKGPTVSDGEVHQTLINLGVFAPWQDLLVLRHELGLDPEDESTSLIVKKRDALIQKSFSSPPTRGSPLGPEDFHPSDPLAAVRHDFGDSPVYVIDDATAEELDDGVSIERIPSEPDSFWVHIHIADPASLIPPTHFLAQEAKEKGESTYLVHRTWSLFPKSLVHSPQHGLSLGSKSATGSPDQVLSFSAKVNANGDIVDYKVRAGLINNIDKLNYDLVDHMMGSPMIPRSYPFGGASSQPCTIPFSESRQRDLVDLHTVAKRLVSKRVRDGSLNYNDYTAEISGFSPIDAKIKTPTMDPCHFRGFPKLQYSVATMEDLDTGSRNMVAEMMKVACRLASRFCLDHNIPLLRRSAMPIVTASESDLQKLLDMRSPKGYIPYRLTLPFKAISPPAIYGTEPKGHFGLGVPDGEGYTRVTSPLRRYGDLVAHWQIHHALLGSAAPSSSPPFDTRQLQEFGITFKARDRLRSRANDHHDRFWSLWLMRRRREDAVRGIEHAEDPLANLEGYILSPPTLNVDTRDFHCEVQIPKLGIRGFLGGLSNANPLLPGTAVPLEVHELCLGTRPQLHLVLGKRG